MNPSLLDEITEAVLKEFRNKPKQGKENKITFSSNLNTVPDFSKKTSGSQQAAVKTLEVQSGDKHPSTTGKVTFSRNLDTIPTFSGLKTVRQPENEDLPEADFTENREGLKDPELVKEHQAKTPSRIGIGRAGVRPPTKALLKFRLDHAAAVDAVYGEVTEELLNKLDLFTVQSQVDEKSEFILRPDLGRKLNQEGKDTIAKKCQKEPQVQIVLSDGLSSEAVEKNAEDVYLSLQQSLKQLGLSAGTPFYVKNGRVAVMDDIGEILKPEVIILLIGERPGLISAESLSAYICYKPRHGMIEANRMVVSNIHAGGIPPAEAGAYLGSVLQKVLHYKASGIELIKKEN